MCSSGRWKGERGLCFVGNRVYLLLAVEVQSRSEQRLLVPFIHFSKLLVFCSVFFFLFVCLFVFFLSFFILFGFYSYFIMVRIFLYISFVFFKGGRALRREGEHLIALFLFYFTFILFILLFTMVFVCIHSLITF